MPSNSKSSGTDTVRRLPGSAGLPNGVHTYTMFTMATMMVNSTARPMNPMPVARPMAMAKNTLPISFAEPGILRKRTRLNTPITAMPAPRLPFTSVMTICTMSGKSANVTTKFFE